MASSGRVASSGQVRVAAVCGLLGVVLAGCGAGQTAATSRDLPSVPGVNVDADGVGVRNALVAFQDEGYAPGDTAPIELSIVNDTDTDTGLRDASSEVAASVAPAGGDAVEIPAYGLVTVTLEAGPLGTRLDGASAVPLELTFDNGTVLTMNVPMALPMDPLPRAEPLEVGHH